MRSVLARMGASDGEQVAGAERDFTAGVVQAANPAVEATASVALAWRRNWRRSMGVLSRVVKGESYMVVIPACAGMTSQEGVSPS
jgi:hypothetical protein